MTFEVWLLYVTTVLAFMVTPGPSHLLMLSNSMSHGFRLSLSTAAGDLSANFLQMLAAGIGLAAVLTTAQEALSIIKWLGAAYLLWMGVKMILGAKRAADVAAAEKTASRKALWLQGFLTSAANPKAVVFFAALFPQFISASSAFVPQFVVLSITYLVIDGLFLATYGAGATWLASRLKNSARIFINRLGGTFLIGAAVMLGLKTMRESNQ